jgi:hypothetical protein
VAFALEKGLCEHAYLFVVFDNENTRQDAPHWLLSKDISIQGGLRSYVPLVLGSSTSCLLARSRNACAICTSLALSFGLAREGQAFAAYCRYSSAVVTRQIRRCSHSVDLFLFRRLFCSRYCSRTSSGGGRCLPAGSERQRCWSQKNTGSTRATVLDLPNK